MLEIFDAIEQGSDAWRRIRLGLPTASEFGAILAKGEGKTRRSYLLRLAGEILTGEPTETYSNGHMERGQLMEAEARDYYAFMRDADLRRVGFIRNGDKGCSPDSLIGDNGMLEIKTQRADLLIETLLKDEFPPAHKAQCQGGLWVAERDWIDITVYWPRMPTFIKRAHRDEAYIRSLAAAVAAFDDELQATVERVRAYSDPAHLQRALQGSLEAAQ